MAVDALESRVVSPYLLIEKHLHPAPLLPIRPLRLQEAKNASEVLNDVAGLQEHQKADERQSWSKRAKYRPSTVRPNDFVVA